ncbi:MAG: TfoX/Sxy family protein [Chitinophagales bacterium]
MAYNEALAHRIREFFEDFDCVEEKKMMGGLVFMVNDKMCVGVIGDDLMCRVDPDSQNSLLELTGCRMMDMGGKLMRGFLAIDETGMRTTKSFRFWIEQALQFNPKAKKAKGR